MLLGAGALSLGDGRRAAAQPAQPIRTGVLTDMNGPNGSITGAGSIRAAKLAVRGREDERGGNGREDEIHSLR
jgi:hypothetical protein